MWYLSFSKKKKRQKKCMFLLSVQRQMSRIVGNKQTNKQKLKEDVPIEMGRERDFLSQRLRTQNLRTRI